MGSIAAARLYWRMPSARARSTPRPARASARTNPRGELDKTVDELAGLLTRAAGRKLTAAQIRGHVKSGAPRNRDGSINVLNYAAWLAREAARDGG